MKLKRQFVFIVSGILGILSLLSIYQWNAQQSELHKLYGISAQHHLSIFDNVIELKTGKFKTYAYDYSYWDELIAYIAHPDPEWAKVNLEETAVFFETDAIFVVNPSGKIMYKVGSLKSLETLSTQLQKHRFSFDTPVFENFFIRTSEGPVEIFCAPIQHSDDIERSGKPFGYLITARKWDKLLLSDLGNITQVKLNFVKPTDQTPYDRVYPLLDSKGNVLYQIGIRMYSDEIDMLTRIFQTNFYALLLFGLSAMTMFIVIFHRKVLSPLQTMTDAMQSRDMSQLAPLSVRKDEVGDIAHLIREFFIQQKDLQIQLKRADEAEKEQLVIKDRIQRANAVLMQRVQEKNKELEEINLSLDQRIHEEIEKSRKQEQILLHQSRLVAMGEMIGNIAHQWRQPLNVLGLSIQNLEMASEFGELDHDYILKMIDISMKQVTYMSKTIDDFRNFVNPNATKTRFGLNDAIDESIRLLTPTLTASDITTTINAPQTPIVILGNASEFKQVIVNLINNAKDAFNESKIDERKMDIRVMDSEKNVTIEFEDNAGGIRADIIGRIFEPYFTTKAEGKGTGIGLYMSYGIITEKMDGTITVENTQHGAKFVITIPKADSQEER